MPPTTWDRAQLTPATMVSLSSSGTLKIAAPGRT
jgi:hypothetical protein